MTYVCGNEQRTPSSTEDCQSHRSSRLAATRSAFANQSVGAAAKASAAGSVAAL